MDDANTLRPHTSTPGGAASAAPADGTPRHPDVVALFEARAADAPDALAVACGGVTLTYGELDRRADRLAHHLRERGVGPETRVGVCLERSPELVVALLGVWKAGGAWVPLDPAYPGERLAYVLRDSAVPVLVTHTALASGLPAHGAGVVLVDAPADREGRERSAAPPRATGPGSLAYVIYTSGSTGEPKGVLVEHGSLAATLRAIREEFRFTADDVVACVAPFSFDIFLFELLAPLVSGGASLLLRRDEVLDARTLVRRLERATVLHAVPSLMREVVAALKAPGAAGLRRVRAVFVGGDAVPPELLAEMREVFPGAELHVLYGPTEATIVCSAYRVPAEGEVPGHMLGRPLGDAVLRLRDAEGNDVADGAEGELHVGGPGVTRGYLGRERLTAERYVTLDGGRFYRTGDLARRRPDGSLEFRGRADRQVKVRGFRIEPGEVEAVLRGHPGVRDAVVVAREEGGGERRLVAYLATGDGRPAEGVRGHARERLPEHMVPEAFVALPALPLTPHGKVDHGALPDPAPEAPRSEGPESRTPTERALAAVFAEVLGVERVGIHDDFFALGGHSLRAMRVISRVREVLGADLSPAAFFGAPTVAGLAAAVAGEGSGGAAADPYARPVPRPDPVPLSYSQEAVWLLQKLFPGIQAYSFHAAIRFTGALDLPVLERTLSEIVRRHEIFRTVFPVREGAPLQRVLDPWTVRLPVEDLRGFPEPERSAEVQRRLLAEFRQPYDLARLPLVRWKVLRLADDEHLLVHAEHHFLHDGWSFGIFLREIDELYRAFARGEPSPLPEPTLQFADFAVRQREWVRGPEAEAQVAYWKGVLAGAPVLELPTDRARPPVMTFRGTSLRIKLPPRLAGAVRAFGARHGATVYMTLLAAFQELLHRYGGSEDFCVGSAFANRRWRSLEGVVGFLVNMVALRADLADDPTFLALVERVRGTALDAYANADVPFERVVAALQPERRISHLPLFQTAFSFHDSAYPAFDLPGVAVEVSDGLSNESAKFDLNVIVIPHAEQSAGASPEDVTLLWEYNVDLFDAATVERMVRGFTALLEAAVAHPERRISELPAMPPEELHQVVQGWNDTAAPYDRALCIHEPFERRAELTPDALAGVFGERRMTYGELNREANRIAHRLKEAGVGPGKYVGIYMERSLEMLPALFGILKAGGAYVPIDAAYPAGRVAWILASMGIGCVVTQSALLPVLEGVCAETPDLRELICLDPDGEGADPDAFPGLRASRRVLTRADLGGLPSGNPERTALVEAPAYVIFTSGSTGTPKGVSVSHAPVINLIEWVNRTYDIGPADRVLCVASLCFDLSVYDIFGLLAAGGSVQVPSEEDVRDPVRLLALLRREPITFWDSAPAAMQQLVPFFGRVREGDDSGNLRVVFFSGDWIPLGLPDAVRGAFPNAQVIALGGGTEATVWSNFYPYRGLEPHWVSIPYGKPIQNARYHVLDGGMGPCPVGVPGDLYIGGECLVTGYANEPILTASKFVPDPFSPVPGGRLYRTGDRARYFPDGNLEFLGRLDHQVKVRGFRIELGEIESVLLRHPAVREALVVAQGDARGEKQLVAYVVPPEGAAAPPAADLRAHLRASLPEYMVPSAFVALEGIPVTPNGKVDRKALPAPGAEGTRREEHVAPRTPTEEALAAIWREVLGVERVGVHDDFFELGGHSLLATQVVARVESRMGIEVQLRDLMLSPTIGEFGARVDEAILERMAGLDLDALLAAVDGGE